MSKVNVEDVCRKIKVEVMLSMLGKLRRFTGSLKSGETLTERQIGRFLEVLLTYMEEDLSRVERLCWNLLAGKDGGAKNG